MKVLVNGREARGPGAYIFGALAIALVLAFLFIVVLPLVGIAVAIAAGAGAVYVGARAIRSIGRKRRGTLESDDATYRVESSRQHQAKELE